MTIQEAIKSGRPFKRKSSNDPCWLVVTTVNLPGLLGYESNEDGGEAPISETHASDILAEDWIVKPDFESLVELIHELLNGRNPEDLTARARELLRQVPTRETE